MFFSWIYKFVDPHTIINTYGYADKYSLNSQFCRLIQLKTQIPQELYTSNN